ncbi:MAG: PAS domain S-box protein [Desulfobacterales bacterium]|nr:PAS domain S-box protein [Desulfobacterales bacterium]
MNEKPTYEELEKRVQVLEEAELGRKRATEELRRSEEKYRELVERINDVLYAVDAGGTITYLSPRVESVLGYAPSELIGSPFAHLIHPDDLPAILEAFNDVLQGLHRPSEYRLRAKSGGYRWIRTSSRLVRDGDRDGGLIGVLTDITDRKRAEDQLKSSEQLLNEMGSIAKIGGWEHDLITGKATWTKETYKIVGIESGPVPGPEEHLDYYPPEDRAVLEKAYRRAMETGEQFDLELRGTTAKGRLFWSRAIGRPEFKDGNCVKVKGIFQDITEQKELKERLQQAQKMESIGTLAGGIAHDFNNILFPIIGLSELFLEDLSPGSLAYDNVQEILKAGKRGSELVQQILAFSRQTEHKMMPVRVQQILKETLGLVRSTIPSNIEMTHDIQVDCGLVMADPTQLHQIAMNLLTNAYHAVEPTGGEIAVQLKETDVVDGVPAGRSLEPGTYAMLTVSDTGSGIDPAVLDKIFEPYFTTKAKGKGTGLGLAVVYGIVKEYRGDIKVFSQAGKGATFNVYLPLMQKYPGTPSVEKPAIYQTGNERVLLVDDEEPIVRLEKQMLERLGYKVTSRVSSLEALEAFRANPDSFDLVITDVTMPNMTGDQLARELLSIKPGLPVIICTGFSERISRDKAAAIGIKGFLMKPIVKSDMAQMVRNVLDAGRAVSVDPVEGGDEANGPTQAS